MHKEYLLKISLLSTFLFIKIVRRRLDGAMFWRQKGAHAKPEWRDIDLFSFWWFAQHTHPIIINILDSCPPSFPYNS